MYLKDDDFMLSFMYGNFITLTNLNSEDISRIKKSRLEPLYISIHSLDKQARKKIFQTDNHALGLVNFRKLDDSGISTHVQIVLCPHINDGDILRDTLFRLNSEYSNIKSIGIVPVGITRYNKSKYLRAVDKKTAENTIEMVESFNKRFGTEGLIFLSDEFYINACQNFPGHEHYRNFPQIENGIGKSRDFIFEFKSMAEGKKLNQSPEVLVITSLYGEYVFNVLKNEISSLTLDFDVMAVKNNFLGGNVGVAGLLGGEDIMDSLKKVIPGPFKKILVPDSIFNKEGLTIDGFSRESIGKISNKLIFIEENAKSLIGELI